MKRRKGRVSTQSRFMARMRHAPAQQNTFSFDPVHCILNVIQYTSTEALNRSSLRRHRVEGNVVSRRNFIISELDLTSVSFGDVRLSAHRFAQLTYLRDRRGECAKSVQSRRQCCFSETSSVVALRRHVQPSPPIHVSRERFRDTGGVRGGGGGRVGGGTGRKNFWWVDHLEPE